MVMCVEGDSDETIGSLECEHQLPRLPHTTVARRFRDKCFQFVSVEKYWPEARRYCHQVSVVSWTLFIGPSFSGTGNRGQPRINVILIRNFETEHGDTVTDERKRNAGNQASGVSNKPTSYSRTMRDVKNTIRRRTNARSVKSWTGQRAEMFDRKFGVHNLSKCDFKYNKTICTLPVFDRVIVRLRVRFGVQIIVF